MSQAALEQRISQLEAELKASQAKSEKYKALFDLSADAFSIIDMTTGRFVECNEAAVALHGVENESNFLNLAPADLSPTYQPCGTRSDILSSQYIEDTLNRGPQLFQWLHSKLDGSTFPCLVSLSAINVNDQKLILAVGRDITELSETKTQLDLAKSEIKRYQSAYLEEKQKFEQFVNLAPVGIVQFIPQVDSLSQTF